LYADVLYADVVVGLWVFVYRCAGIIATSGHHRNLMSRGAVLRSAVASAPIEKKPDFFFASSFRGGNAIAVLPRAATCPLTLV
jgi:hypothetical protein